METLKRLIVGFSFAPILLIFLFNNFLEGVFFFSVFVLAAILGFFELKKIFLNKGVKINSVLVLCFIVVSWLIEYISRPGILDLEFFIKNNNIQFWLIVMLFSISSAIEVFRKNFDKSFEKIGAEIITFIYLGIMFPNVYKIKMIAYEGPYIFLYILFVVWICDIFAYFSGKFFGRHKLNLPVSPNKTLEGFIGGFIFAFISAFIIRHFFFSKVSSRIFSLEYFIPITFLLIVLTIIGDLIESVFKRASHVKDSQNIVPGHGGVLSLFS
jgi:phosphatidate cytidylyltransferase